LPRSRTVRALTAIGAGVTGAGSVVCATLAFTHAAHHSTHVASLTTLPAVGGAPRAAEPTSGLLAWHAPAAPPGLVLSPVVVGSVRVVDRTRYVKARPKAVTPRTTPARYVAAPRRQARPRRRTTTPTTTRPRRRTTEDRTERARDEQRRNSDDTTRTTSEESHDDHAGHEDGE
jgi:hypothetical protein